MLVFATPRPKDSEEICLPDLNEHGLSTVVSELGGDSLVINTLHRTLSARMRRRERVNLNHFYFLTTLIILTITKMF